MSEEDENPTAGNISVGGDATGSSIILGNHNIVNINPPAPAPPSALFTIPPPPKNFIGRGDELDDLLANFQRGAVISGLSGGGGVGKSALARALAQHLVDQFPDARLQIDLQGAPHPGQKPLTPVDALRRLLQSFHPTVQLPDDLPSLQAILTDTLRNRRVLFLLDNARDAAQVRPLLPPAPSAAIVTSRIALALPDVGLYSSRPLGALRPAAARELLRINAPALASASDVEVDKLARLCGALPLALNVAAALLSARPDWTLARLIQLLTDERTRLQKLKSKDDPNLDVEASLELSYNLLDEDAQRLFRTLGIFPAPFDLPSLGAIWQLSPEACDEAIGDLLRLSLVEYRAGEAMPYQLHDLTRIYVESRLRRKPDEWSVAVQYHADYFLERVVEVDGLYEQGHEHVLESLDYFDVIWPHLQIAYERILPNVGNKHADRWLSNFPSEAVQALELRLNPHQRIPLLHSGLAAARRLKDRVHESIHLCNLGLAYKNIGEPYRAIECYEQGLIIDREIGSQRGAGADLGNLGNVYKDLGEPHRAIEYYEQALIIDLETGDRGGEGADLNNLGMAYADLSDLHRAIEYYEQALIITREIGNPLGEGNVLNNLGIVYAKLGELNRAMEFYNQVLIIAHKFGGHRMEGAVLGNLGLAYTALGETQRAMEFFKQQLSVAYEIGDRIGEANASWNIGLLLEVQGQFEQAVQSMQVCVDFYRAIGHSRLGEFESLVEKVRQRAENSE